MEKNKNMALNSSCYVFLPSNGDTNKIYKKNDISSFTIPLAKGIYLNDNVIWEVGVSEIFIPNYIYNIIPPHNEIYISGFSEYTRSFDGNAHAPILIVIEPGSYTPQMLIKTINRKLSGFSITYKTKYGRRIEREAKEAREREEASTLIDIGQNGGFAGYTQVDIVQAPVDEPLPWYLTYDKYNGETYGNDDTSTFHQVVKSKKKRKKMEHMIEKTEKFNGFFGLHPESQRLTVHLKKSEEIRIPSLKLREMLGFEDDGVDTLKNKTNDSCSQQLPYPVNLDIFLQHLCIYSNIVESSPIGDFEGPIIRVVDGVSGDKNNIIYRAYARPQYFKLSQRVLKEIEIKITNTLGESLMIQSGKSLVVLHLRKRMD